MIKFLKNKIIKISVIAMLIISMLLISLFSIKNVTDVMAKTTLETVKQALRDKGFPESYIDSLAELKINHPNWEFEAVQTGLDWNVVLKNEMVLKRNLVPLNTMALKGVYFNSAGVPSWYATPTSWKSTEIAGAYNWTNNKWTTYDSGSWVQASETAISYIMDPRNWITENNIFAFEYITYNSEYQTNDLVEKSLSGTFMANTKVPGTNTTYAKTLLSAGEKYGISAIFLGSRLKQEQGENGNTLAHGVVYDSELVVDNTKGHYRAYDSSKDKGKTVYYNFFNINASGDSKQKIIDGGATEAKKLGWTSPLAALTGGAQKVMENYIKNSGRDTVYFQKFSVVKSDYYYLQYMQNLLAPVNEGYETRTTYASKGYLDSHFIFKIPVYENMPESASTKPSPEFSTANPNYKLSQIFVKGNEVGGKSIDLSKEITPTFNTDITTYSLTVPYEIESLSITGTPYANTSKVTVSGNTNLVAGKTNTIKVVCTSELGTSRTYKFNVYRIEGSVDINSITIGTGSLKPSFDVDTLKYDICVNNSTDSVKITYKTESSIAKVVLRYGSTTELCSTGSGSTTLKLIEGKNVYYLDVYPSADVTDTSKRKTYTLQIFRYTNTTYDISSYQISGTETLYANETRYINGFTIGDTVAKVLNNLSVEGGSAKVVSSTGNSTSIGKDSSSLIGTGDIIYILDSNGFVMQRMRVVMYGDVNGDGKVDLFDRAYIKKYLWGHKEILTGIYLRAGDVYEDTNGIDLFDRACIKKYLWGSYEIKQTR